MANREIGEIVIEEVLSPPYTSGPDIYEVVISVVPIYNNQFNEEQFTDLTPPKAAVGNWELDIH